jgi:Phytanoyl-CoA dioxygenase (PhyH)
MTEAPDLLTVGGRQLDCGAETLGDLRRTAPARDGAQLRSRLGGDGYLYLPGFWTVEEVLAVRGRLVERLSAGGILDPTFPALDGVLRPGAEVRIGIGGRDLVAGNVLLHRILYTGRIVRFFEHLLGGAVRHFDYTWLRAVPPGGSTRAHADIVFMGRGTTNLLTAWVPWGDVSMSLGGLALLEGSHLNQRIREDYGRRDVDTYCDNRGERPRADWGYQSFDGVLDDDPAALQLELGGRWLTSEYRAGDLLVFGMFMVHVGLDNRTHNQLRLSSDSRYQLASEAADERWIGPDPPGHSRRAKRGLIC